MNLLFQIPPFALGYPIETMFGSCSAAVAPPSVYHLQAAPASSPVKMPRH
jgi:hypothetical protein